MSAGDPFVGLEIPARNLTLNELNERCRVVGWPSKRAMDDRDNRGTYLGWLAGTEHSIGARYMIVHVGRGGDQPAVPIWVDIDEPLCFVGQPETNPAHFGQ